MLNMIQTINTDHLSLTFDEKTLLKAMVRYGRAVWRVYYLYRHLLTKAGARRIELEVSVNETDDPTAHAEYAYIASELKRLGINWVSLAPRFVGRFEKGVDYIEDLEDFEQDIKDHAAIARVFGPYKISLHSGSDKFSICKIAAQANRGLVHLKTAGTSYLEALRTIATIDPNFFGENYKFCQDRYETDKASYHVSAQVSRAPLLSDVDNLTELLDNFDAREILHVTFGSVLKEKSPDGSFLFFERLLSLPKVNSEEYARNVEQHFLRHLTPFVE